MTRTRVLTGCLAACLIWAGVATYFAITQSLRANEAVFARLKDREEPCRNLAVSLRESAIWLDKETIERWARSPLSGPNEVGDFHFDINRLELVVGWCARKPGSDYTAALREHLLARDVPATYLELHRLTRLVDPRMTDLLDESRARWLRYERSPEWPYAHDYR